MKRENILINEDYTTKRVAATKFIAPGDVPAFDCLIRFGKEENDVTMQNCNIKDSAIVKCSPDDEYDFETGALIALMKMCGFDKSYKAIEEAFKYNSYDTKKSKVYEEKIHTLEKEKEQIIVAKNILYNNLEKENEKLKKRINELESYNAKLEERIAGEQSGGYKILKDMEKLKEENARLEEENKEVKESDKYAKSEVGRLCFEKHRLEKENKMLCDKIKFLDKENRNLIYGGRQNGKQYTFLVELFKKIPQNKVDAAYKEAYNTTLPVWQKEVLKQMYDVYEESKEKTVQIKGFNINIKPSTKREEMWNDILACGDCEHSKYVEVKKEDLEAFAKECNEKKIFSIIGYEFNPQSYWSDDDSYIFQIFRKPAGFICAIMVGFASEDTVIDYLPPMRWDLFKKGRIVVKVDADNYEDFYNKCEVEIGRKPHYTCKGTFTVYYKNGTFHTRPYKDTIPFAKKIVDWEDVR